ncbi:MAG: DUF5686 family protein [Bacteroidia bacterium]
MAQTIVRGVVTDEKTGDPLPFVSVQISGTTIGKNTDFNGQYLIQTDEPAKKIKFTLIGYNTMELDLKEGQSQIISVKMTAKSHQLKEVSIEGKKQRYKNKDNPAVDLIRRVIDNKKLNRKEDLQAFQYEKYEKVQFALSNISEKFKNRKYMKNFQFVFDNLDSNQMPGKVILPMYLQETLSDVYYKKEPKGQKEIIKAQKKVDFNDLANSDGVGTFVSYLYQDINIYDNTVPVLTNNFISPIADNGPLFYRYYILDTVLFDNTRCYHMSFYPRNKADFVFQGELWITFDTAYAVRKNEMMVSPDINLNFVKELKITQEYTQVSPGEYLLTTDNISIDFGIGKNGLGVFGQRAMNFNNYTLNQPKEESFYSGLSIVKEDSASMRSENYFDEHRHLELTQAEKGVYTMVDSIQKVPAFRHTVSLLEILLVGYKDFGKIEIGPINTFVSYNPIEGYRVRFGGRTTTKFTPRMQFEGNVMYGIGDKKWKYFVGVKQALGKSSFIDFPQKNLSISYSRETKIPGQELQFVQEDNGLLSIKRGVNDKLLYNKIMSVDYLSEFPSHFSYNIGVKNVIQSPAGTLHFNTEDYNAKNLQTENEITTTSLSVLLRYAPHEQFYQNKNYRKPMYNEYPIIQVKYEGSLKDVLKSDYTFHHLVVNIFKRINVSPIGYSDLEVEAGKVFGKVPYPLLEIHRANQTYSYQVDSYNLMNFLEFVSDEYTSLYFTHYWNGFFFNKIPLFKKLKWREVMSLKMIYGRITPENDPSLHPDLFKLPIQPDGTPITYSLSARPYIEASVGVANIFKFIRVDLVKRINYLDHPNVSTYGIRARLKLDF